MSTLKDLKANPKNPRTITDEKLAMLKKSLAEFGDLSGIVFNKTTGQIVGGHQRVKILPATTKIHITKTYTTPTKVGTLAEGYAEWNGERFKYRRVAWDEFKEKAANIAANKGAGEWNIGQLSEWMRDLEAFDFDLDLTMFDEAERVAFLKAPEKENRGECDEDEIPKPPRIAKSKLGQLYQLGQHRLLCGDSTLSASYDKVLGSKKAAIAFTSPPYNLGDNAKLRGHLGTGTDTVYTEKSDHKSQKEYLSFLGAFTQILINRCAVSFINIQMLAGNKLIFPEYWYAFRNKTIDVMVWDKEHGAPSMAPNVLNCAFEFVFIFSDHDEPKRSITTGEKFHGTISNIFRCNPKREGKEEIQKGHGAVFPVSFPEFFITSFSKAADIVLEPFGGTGTTLIACEKNGRKCAAIELDPIYVDVIIARWEKFTGQKAKLI